MLRGMPLRMPQGPCSHAPHAQSSLLCWLSGLHTGILQQHPHADLSRWAFSTLELHWHRVSPLLALCEDISLFSLAVVLFILQPVSEEGWPLTTPTLYRSLFPTSRENWLRSMVRWQMRSVTLPETWHYRWHLIHDSKEHSSSHQPVAFIFMMSSACRWLTWDSGVKCWALSGGSHGQLRISPSVWSPAWWAWTTAIFISVLVCKSCQKVDCEPLILLCPLS